MGGLTRERDPKPELSLLPDVNLAVVGLCHHEELGLHEHALMDQGAGASHVPLLIDGERGDDSMVGLRVSFQELKSRAHDSGHPALHVRCPQPVYAIILDRDPIWGICPTLDNRGHGLQVAEQRPPPRGVDREGQRRVTPPRS